MPGLETQDFITHNRVKTMSINTSQFPLPPGMGGGRSSIWAKMVHACSQWVALQKTHLNLEPQIFYNGE